MSRPLVKIKQSAGILAYRKKNTKLEVFLVHHGGPFWARRDFGAWSIPKGEFKNEKSQDAARREFKEETGYAAKGSLLTLTPQELKGGKIVHAFAIEMDIDPQKLKSAPSKFGWPEVDRGEWFDPKIAKEKINQGQIGFLNELTSLLDGKKPSSA